MFSIDINSELEMLDGTYLTVGFHGSLLKLRHCATGEYSTVHIADISRNLIEPPPRLTVDPHVLDSQSDSEIKALDRYGVHIMEMDSGERNEGDGEMRDEYNPATTTLNERIASKVLELNALGLAASRATLLRKRKAYKAGGLAALVDGRTIRKEGPLDRADVRVLQVLRDVIAKETMDSTGTGRRLQSRFVDALLAAYPGANIPAPSEQTLYRYVNFLTKGKYTTGNSKNRRSAAVTPKRPFGTARRMRPGQEVQIDSSPWDILIRDAFGNLIRVQLTIMIDVATRSIIGVSVRPTATKGVDHAFLLAQCLVPRQLRPGSEELWKLTERRLPWMQLTPESERERLDFTRPFIFPERIMMDNGADYRSVVFQSACRKFGVTLTYAAPGTGTDKAIVERTFKSIKTLWAQDLPGFKGSDVISRGDRPEKGALLDAVTLAASFEEWVTRVWQNRPHENLMDPMYPSIKMSPNEMYNASFDLAAQLPLPLDTTDFIELMPVEWRTIQTSGVKVNLNYYDSIELYPFHNLPSNDKAHDNKWEVRVHPYDPRQVWVRHPEGHFIECLWHAEPTFTQPFADEILRSAVDLASTRTDVDQSDLNQLSKEIKKRTAATALTLDTVRERNRVATLLSGNTATPMPSAMTCLVPASLPEDGSDEEQQYFEEYDDGTVDLGSYDDLTVTDR